jgi:hypothetical protein
MPEQIRVDKVELNQLINWLNSSRGIVAKTEEIADNPDAVRTNCNRIKEYLEEILFT